MSFMMKKRLQLLAALVGVVAALGLVGVGVSTSDSRRKQAACAGNLKALGVAFHEYHEKYKHFPPAYVLGNGGKPAHSWRVLLLEFIDPALYHKYSFQEPWNGRNNSKLLAQMPRCYQCPNSRPSTKTNYVVIVGKGTVCPGNSPTSLNDIKDDRATTLLIVEVANSTIYWMEPTDLNLSNINVGPSANQ